MIARATAGGAYQPGLSDYIVMIREQSTVYLAGPPLLKAATGEIATDEEIGGAQMHSAVAGTADYLAEDDADGIRIAREIVGKLGWNQGFIAPARADDYREPLYPASELVGIVPADPKTPYDVREIVARVADGSDFLDFKPEFDMGTVCGHMALSQSGSPWPTAQPKRASSSNCVNSPVPRSCSCTIPPDFWSAPKPSRRALSNTAPNSFRLLPTVRYRRYRSWSGDLMVQVTMRCADGAWSRVSCLPGHVAWCR